MKDAHDVIDGFPIDGKTCVLGVNDFSYDIGVGIVDIDASYFGARNHYVVHRDVVEI